MSLLTKAKVITTPTAYSDGILHSVKPIQTYEATYESDFTSGNEDLVESSGIGTDGQSIDGVNDAYKFTLTLGSATHQTRTNTNPLSADDKYVITFDYYIPSSNAEVNQIRVLNNDATIVEFATINDAWATYSFSFTGTGTHNLYFRAYNGVSYTIDADGDVFYLKNIKVEKAINADFTFTRNSSATRVGEDGYIQDVQIIGGELVQNGDFEQIGSELVTNGNFDTDSDWTLTNFTISNGKANVDSSVAAFLTQTSVATIGKVYRVEFTISDYVEGRIRLRYPFTNGDLEINPVQNQTYVYYGVATDTRFELQSRFTEDINYKVDNVSVKEVGQNWTFGTGWSIADVNNSQVAQFDGGADSSLQQSGVISNGIKYRLSFDVLGMTTGSLRIRLGDALSNDETITTNGSYTYDIVSDGTNFIFRSGGGFDGSVDNVSVKEVTDDTNLPRINYEGFSYENGLPIYGSGKGHLLLEPQRSNIAYKGGGLSVTGASETSNFGISPSGDNNSTKLESTASGISYVRTANLNTVGTLACSIFVKKGIGDYIQLLHAGNGNHYANYDLVNGVVTSEGSITTASIESYGDWLRLIAVFDSVTVSADFRCYLSDSPTAGYGGASSAIGNYCEFWGIQAEEGDYATSYIANTTPSTIVTRAAETCNNAGNADLFDSEGVLYAHIASLANDGTNRMISISDDTNANRITLYYSPITNQIAVIIKQSAITSYQEYYSALSNLDYHKIAIRYKDNDFSFWINGVQVGTGSSGIVPSGLKQLAFDYGDNLNFPFYGKTKMVGVFPYLSNDEMECLTGEGYGSFGAMALANNYTII